MKFIIVFTGVTLLISMSRLAVFTGIDHWNNDTVIVSGSGRPCKIVTAYKDGFKHGVEYYICNNDTIQATEYKNGKRDGKELNFYQRNRVSAIRFFVNDSVTGEWLAYDSNGAVQMKIIYDRTYSYNDRRWSGRQIFFHNNKEIFTQVWLNGRRCQVFVADTAQYDMYKTNDVSLGNKLFYAECAACHSLNRDVVGPALVPVVNTRPRGWLTGFIRNADSLYNIGDKHTKELYMKYNPTKHPGFTYLSVSDIEAILQFIEEK